MSEMVVPTTLNSTWVDEIPLLRASYLALITDHLDARGVRHGGVLQSALQDARLPMIARDDRREFVAATAVERFAGYVAVRAGLDELVLRAARNATVTVLTPPVRRMLSDSTSLIAALRGYRDMSKLERSRPGPRLIRRGTSVLVHTSTPASFGRSEASWMANFEWLDVCVTVAVVRAFAGPRWQPREIGVSARWPVSGVVRRTWPEARFVRTRGTSYVEVPSDVLRLAPMTTCRLPADASRATTTWEPASGDFAGSLGQLLRPYIRHGVPNLDEVASIAGTSRRTLQRRLARRGASYSTLVRRVRLDAAITRLSDPGASVLDVAFDVGYDDASHFSRAFRRVFGCSPTEYRRNRFTDRHVRNGRAASTYAVARPVRRGAER